MSIATGEEAKPKLVPLPGTVGGVLLTGRTPASRLRPRHRILFASFVICVLLPAFLSAVYYVAFASDRYVAGAGFAIRSTEATGTDMIGAITGLSTAHSTTSDAYILLKYLGSRDIVERLSQDFPLQEHYSSEEADWLMRLDEGSSIENLVNYWNRRIHANYNSASGIVTFEVEAFDPVAAERLASLVLAYCRDMVNHLSGEARRDAVAFSAAEVERAEGRLKTVLEAIRQFRETEQSLDPAGSARIRLELVGGLERQLADLRARISALQASLDKDAPSLRSLTRQAEALEQQIARERAGMTAHTADAAGSATLSNQLAVYETLEVERSFAQQYYASALSSLETARINADRHQRYLAVYSAPVVPEQAAYPRRVLNILLLAAGLTLVWAIGALIGYAVRDHLR
ncbi:RkpR, polysaccharide export protein [Nitratireductor aestuarii]|uniref:RkpR, polysaccharide export protein n=1 Tax=Nitratireductor aestuarii TaxID=1735103 RepID=A0A916RXJ6_9HYPH|nr:lipopolysaccharide biosynthesis protein [Nitratireductor aestuarii]GGA71718.1 RkpR, polysaccharide export protein [Nitratireductor aestuarii]